MQSTEELKKLACDRIDARRDEIIAIATTMLANPETGFTETKTSRMVQEHFARMSIPYRAGLAITGVKGEVPCGRPGPRVAVIGELDSLVVRNHPYADPVTGAAHACGHHAQVAMMLGAVMGLHTPPILSALSGTIIPFAVPAEEFIEVERRLRLRDEGKVELLEGKQELIRLGEFDDVNMAMMCHTAVTHNGRMFVLGGTSNGHVVKYVQFMGRGAHAGGAPHKGINALNAAMLAINAIHANRETMRDDDTVRIHGIITRGGEAVSAVPADVRLEWRVRSRSREAIVENGRKVDRCFKAGAMAVGAKVRITNIPGCLPMRNDPTLMGVFRANAEALVSAEGVLVRRETHNQGSSTDMGDLSHVLPAIHPYVAGATGTAHNSDYLIEDYELAVINPAKCLALTAIDLLADGAQKAKEVISKFRPAMAKEEYLRFQREQAQVVEFGE